jgi:hypothetical protein
VNNAVLMDVLNSCKNLMHILGRLPLIQAFSLNDVVEELSPLCVLHNEVNICLGLDDLIVKELTS